jgi:hypothetical protein
MCFRHFVQKHKFNHNYYPSVGQYNNTLYMVHIGANGELLYLQQGYLATIQVRRRHYLF